MIKIKKKHDKVTSTVVLDKIKEMTIKNEMKKAKVGIDTLALLFNLKPADMITLITELEEGGKVKRDIPTTTTRRSCSMGNVTLL